MDIDVVLAWIAMICGVGLVGLGVHHVRAVAARRHRPGWQSATAEVTSVTPTSSLLRAEDDKLATRVAYSYPTPIGAQHGCVDLPLGRAVPGVGFVPVLVDPSRPGRSVLDLPAAPDRQALTTALGSVGLGALLVTGGAAAAAGLIEVDDLLSLKVLTGFLLTLGAIRRWVAGRGGTGSTPEEPRWIAASGRVTHVRDGAFTSRDPFVSVTYTGPDGVERHGTVHLDGEAPATGEVIDVRIDADDPGHVTPSP